MTLTGGAVVKTEPDLWQSCTLNIQTAPIRGAGIFSSHSENFFWLDFVAPRPVQCRPRKTVIVRPRSGLLVAKDQLSYLSACFPNKTPVSGELRPEHPYLHIFRINTKRRSGKNARRVTHALPSSCTPLHPEFMEEGIDGWPHQYLIIRPCSSLSAPHASDPAAPLLVNQIAQNPRTV